MKKIFIFLTLIIFYVSCTNTQTSPNYEYSEQEPIKNQTNENGIITNDIVTNGNQKTYIVYTANIEINNTNKNVWIVKEGDVELLEQIWEATITKYNGGLTVAYGPTYSAEQNKKGVRRAYFGYELGKTGKEAFNMYDKKDTNKIINEFKGVRLVRLPEKRENMDPTGGILDKTLTVAGIYTVTENANNAETGQNTPQYVLQDQAIAFCQDRITTTGNIENDRSIFYPMQFMFDRKQISIDTAETTFQPYEYSENQKNGYYNEHRKIPGWTFATKINYNNPK